MNFNRISQYPTQFQETRSNDPSIERHNIGDTERLLYGLTGIAFRVDVIEAWQLECVGHGRHRWWAGRLRVATRSIGPLESDSCARRKAARELR